MPLYIEFRPRYRAIGWRIMIKKKKEDWEKEEGRKDKVEGSTLTVACSRIKADSALKNVARSTVERWLR